MRDSDAADLFLRTFVDDDLGFPEIWRRAIERGEMSPDADIDLLNAGLFYGLMHLTGLRGQPMSAETVGRVINTLVVPGASGRDRSA